MAEKSVETAQRGREPQRNAHAALARGLRESQRLMETGQLAAAIAAMEALAAAHPESGAVRNNLAVALRRAGDNARALECLQHAVRLEPRNADAHYNLGNALRDAGRIGEAMPCYRRAIELRPQFAGAYINLARALADGGKDEEAERCLAAGIAVNADDWNLQFHMGVAQWRRGRDLAALAHYRRAEILKPGEYDVAHNTAAVLMRLDRYAESRAAAVRAIERNPSAAESHAILAHNLITLGQLETAEQTLGRALAIDSGNVSAQLGMARVLLLQGKMERGWPAYEARWKRDNIPFPSIDRPKWNGEDPAGRTVALVTEQGLGDSIQFIRYASLLEERGARVVALCEPQLARLFTGVAGVASVAVKGKPLPDFDCYAPLLSVPALVGTRLESIPARVPYVRTTSPRQRPNRPTIGVVWAGSPKHENDRNRSLALARLMPMLETPGITFVSLQVGPQRGEIDTLGAQGLLLDWGVRIKDFADTAARLAEIDLLISVDTAPAHLMGALGKPVWTLIPYAPDWRWMLGRDGTPWYPTMRLYRQPSPGDWDSVIARLATDLQRSLPRLAAAARSRGGAR